LIGEEHMKIDGACHCRNITYEAEVDVDQVEICHCTDCQILSASAFRVVVPVPAKDFRLLSGAPKNYTKTAESGRKRLMGFCPECGTQIYATSADGEPKVYNVRVGTARQRDQLRPQRQYWTRSALPWIDDIGSLPKFEME
jgi:hypothetical protein